MMKFIVLEKRKIKSESLLKSILILFVSFIERRKISMHEYYEYGREQLEENPQIPIEILKDNESVFQAMAQEMVEEIEKNNDIDKKTVFICPVGPVGHYPYFVERVNKKRVNLKNVWFINMDEYLTDQACTDAGYTDIKVVGIPKTIDNDIAITDHTPGFGSAARYIAATVREIAEDVKSLPIHVCVVEALGRNAGWLTAASALARKKEGDAPHLIYTPEHPFDEEEFLEDVKELYDRLGGVVVVASEGLKKKDGTPIVDPIFKTDRAVYYGDVSSHLANLVVKKLGIKARSEKPGLAGRASVAWQSPVDQAEAQLAGEKALEAALNGHTGVMIGFEREETADGSYRIRTIEIPIEQVMLLEKILPDSYINQRGNDISQEFVQWCRPLIGPDFAEFLDFKEYLKEK